MTESLPGICGPLAYSILDGSGNPIDSIFDDSIDPHFLYVETSDPSSAQTYNFQIVTSYVNYPAISDLDLFTIEVISCFLPSATPTTPIWDQSYTLGDAALTTTSFTDFTIVPSQCTVTYVAQWITPLPDPSLVTYDDVSKSFTIVGSDLSWDGTYTIAVVALDIAGADTGGFFTFDLTVVDLCNTATINLDIL